MTYSFLIMQGIIHKERTFPRLILCGLHRGIDLRHSQTRNSASLKISSAIDLQFSIPCVRICIHILGFLRSIQTIHMHFQVTISILFRTRTVWLSWWILRTVISCWHTTTVIARQWRRRSSCPFYLTSVIENCSESIYCNTIRFCRRPKSWDRWVHPRHSRRNWIPCWIFREGSRRAAPLMLGNSQFVYFQTPALGVYVSSWCGCVQKGRWRLGLFFWHDPSVCKCDKEVRLWSQDEATFHAYILGLLVASTVRV